MHRTIYDYRNGQLLLIGGFTLFFIIAADVGIATGAVDTGRIPPVVALALFSAFLPAPWFFLLAFFFEKLIVDDEGLTWIDRLGRVKVQARWAEVRSVHVSAGAKGRIVASIDTISGPIRVSNSLIGYSELIGRVRSHLFSS